MFWLGMSIFAVLAVLPFICAATLNARDAATSNDEGRPSSATPEER
ncbi:hypothetical protein [Aeromicrobium sp. CTD01-1L150]